ncbi:MAG: hypothetical protein H6577_06020 [Lewinellaceae bacterium]|nr:hypothetical protein [Saprospiraceae bacterium]MCB9337664.1 hypothetical protein [Lewinellaceae bacterium]
MPVTLDRQYWPDSLPLNGSDYFQLLLDRHHRRQGLQGNVSRFAVEVEGKLDAAALERTVNGDPLFIWLHSLRLKRRLPFQLPQWKQVKANRPVSIGIHEVFLKGHGIPGVLFETDIRPHSDPPFRLDLVFHQNNRTTLFFTWNHVLTDAQGAEILIRHLGKAIGDGQVQFFAKEETELPIREQVGHARKVRDFMFDGQETGLSLLLEKSGHPQANRYRVLRFTETETAQVNANCKRYGIRFGRSPLLLAAAMRSFHALLKHKGKTNHNIWVPIPQNQRKKGAWGPLVGNHVSYLFYRLFPQHLETMQSAADAIGEQMMGQMRSGIPASYGIMMGLSRRLPLWLYGYIAKSPTKGALASFFFSDTGNTLDDFTNFCGLPVSDAVHYPPNGGYPGFTVIFMGFQQKLQAVIAYTEAGVSEAELSIFEASLRENLFGKTVV